MNFNQNNATRQNNAFRKMKVSCVIPCYKSEATLGAVIDEFCEAADRRSDYDYEIILVNDGSPDGGATWRTIRAIAERNPHVVSVNLARNFGQDAAVMAGFRYVQGDIVISLDDDGQTPPDEAFKLIDKVRDEDYDIVLASFGDNKQHNAFRTLGSRFNMWCNQHFMGIPKDIEETSYFACKRYVVDCALEYTNPYPFVVGLLFQSIQTYCNVPVKHRAREVGKSGYTLKKLVGLWMNGFTSFSVSPLRFASAVGAITSILGFIIGIILVIGRLFNSSDPEGWTSMMVVLLIVGGLIMLMLGLLGEYVGRIYISLNNHPQYVVRAVHDPRSRNELAR